MQVYKPHLGAYQLYQVDKYYGRKINTEFGLKRELEVSVFNYQIKLTFEIKFQGFLEFQFNFVLCTLDFGLI